MREGRFTALTVGAIVSTIILALAVLFANSYSTGQVIENAERLHSTNSLLGSSAVLRAAINQAALFSRDAALGTATDQAREIAVEEARRTLDTFQDVSGRANISSLGSSDQLADGIGSLAVSASASIEAAGSGDHVTAFEIFNDDFEPAYETVRTELRAIQSETLTTISETQSLAGLVSVGTRFLAILMLPAIAIIIYRRRVRAQNREKRLEYEAKLEYERRLSASKDDLLAGVSHQLRTPVTGIYGMADLLTDDGAVDPDTAREFINSIRSEASDLDRMVADLLMTSRLDAGAVTFKSEPFLVANAVERAVAPLQKSGHDVAVEIGDSVRAEGDLERVVHIVRNLLSNAIKHGGDGVVVSALDAGNRVAVYVEDDGVNPLDESVLFRDFANGGAGALTSGSVGLGLSVARRLAVQMGGDLAYVRHGDRTRFVLTLPGAAVAPTPDLVDAEVAT